MKTDKEMLEAIKEAVFFDEFTEGQTQIILAILADKKLMLIEKATDICDILDIPRRENRRNIFNVINSI